MPTDTRTIPGVTPAAACAPALSWLWVVLARFLHRGTGATFKVGSAYTVDLSRTSVVYCYLLPAMLAGSGRRLVTYPVYLRTGGLSLRLRLCRMRYT